MLNICRDLKVLKKIDLIPSIVFSEKVFPSRVRFLLQTKHTLCFNLKSVLIHQELYLIKWCRMRAGHNELFLVRDWLITVDLLWPNNRRIQVTASVNIWFGIQLQLQSCYCALQIYSKNVIYKEGRVKMIDVFQSWRFFRDQWLKSIYLEHYQM